MMNETNKQQQQTAPRSWLSQAAIALGMALCVGIGVVVPALLAAPAPVAADGDAEDQQTLSAEEQGDSPQQGSAIDSLAEIFTFALNVFTPLTALQVGMIGWLMSNDFVLGNTSATNNDFTMGELLQHMWMTVRNLVNYTLVLVLLAIAAWSVFGSFQEGGEFSPVRTLGKVAIGAVAVNFTWFAGIVVLDASQIAANIVFGLPREVVESTSTEMKEFFDACSEMTKEELNTLVAMAVPNTMAQQDYERIREIISLSIGINGSSGSDISCGNHTFTQDGYTSTTPPDLGEPIPPEDIDFFSDTDIDEIDGNYYRPSNDNRENSFGTNPGSGQSNTMIDQDIASFSDTELETLYNTYEIEYPSGATNSEHLCELLAASETAMNNEASQFAPLTKDEKNCPFFINHPNLTADKETTTFHRFDNLASNENRSYQDCEGSNEKCTKVVYEGFMEFEVHSFNWGDFNLGTIGQLFAYPILKVHSLPKSSKISQSWKDLTIKTIFAIIVVLVLIVVFTALLLVMIERVFILWLNLILSPVGVLMFMVRDIVEIDADNEMLGWKAFISAAFLPVTVSLPMIFGFMVIMTGEKSVMVCPTGNCTEMSNISQILPQVSNIQELFWYIFAIGCLWYSAQLAEDNAKIVKGAISGMNEMVKTGASFVASLPTYAPMIPVKGKNGKETSISIAGMTKGMSMIKNKFEEDSRREVSDLLGLRGNLADQLQEHSEKDSYNQARNINLSTDNLNKLINQINRNNELSNSFLEQLRIPEAVRKDMMADHEYAQRVIAHAIRRRDQGAFNDIRAKLDTTRFTGSVTPAAAPAPATPSAASAKASEQADGVEAEVGKPDDT